MHTKMHLRTPPHIIHSLAFTQHRCIDTPTPHRTIRAAHLSPALPPSPPRLRHLPPRLPPHLPHAPVTPNITPHGISFLPRHSGSAIQCALRFPPCAVLPAPCALRPVQVRRGGVPCGTPCGIHVESPSDRGAGRRPAPALLFAGGRARMPRGGRGPQKHPRGGGTPIGDASRDAVARCRQPGRRA